jgi:hypothetical protein
MTNIRIDIASEFKDRGFKQAEKATTGLQTNLKQLGKTLVGVLSVREVYQFGRASLKAFEQDQQAATRLTQTLGNLGLAFEDSRVTQFIADLEKTSGVLDDSLRPAMQSLLTTTGSVAKSQELLNLALEISRGSGVDVAQLANDLSKAYVGQTRSLAKYNTGLSQAELKTKSFGELQAYLNKQFAGQNAAYLETFSGKVDMLNVAYANMQETIGKGLVDAFTILQGDKGIGGGVTAMDSFAESIANTTRGIANLIMGFSDLRTYGKTVFEFFRSVDPFAPWTGITEMGKVKPQPFRTPMSISGSLDSQGKIEAARKKAEAEAAKRAKELLALTKKQVKAQEALNKKKKEEGILGQIAQRFDLERIQIAAALGGQVNEVEKLRLQLMQAILDEDVKRAIILEGQLIKAESAAKELALLLDSLDEMVGDPFADWPGTITRIQELLKTLKIRVPIETLFAEKGLRLDQKSMTVTTIDRMDVDATNVYINGKPTDAPIGGDMSDVPKDVIDEYLKGNPVIVAAANAAADAADVLAASAAALAALEAEAAEREANRLQDDETLRKLFESLGLDAEGNPKGDVNVTVNVGGSVVTEVDLAEALVDTIYLYQRAGKPITLQNLAI